MAQQMTDVASPLETAENSKHPVTRVVNDDNQGSHDNQDCATESWAIPDSLPDERDSNIAQEASDYSVSDYTSTLCEVCRHINFNAILTPREYDPESGILKATYRPELSGNGKSPYADWLSRSERRAAERAAFIDLGLPKIRTAWYDDLSIDGTDDDDDDDDEDSNEDGDSSPASRNVSKAATNTNVAKSDDSGDDDVIELSADMRDMLVADLDGLDDIEVADDFNASQKGRNGKPDTAYKPDNSGNNVDERDSDNEHEHGEDEDIGSISTWSGASHFTENTRIDLNKQANGNWNYYHGQLYYLGSIWDVRSRRKDCDLCNELWYKMETNADVREQFLTKSRCVLKLLELKGRRVADPKREVTMLNMLFVYAYKIDDPHESPWIVKNPLVLNGTHRDVVDRTRDDDFNEPVVVDDELYGEGRWRFDTCRYDLFQKWLTLCETKHNHPIPQTDNKMKIRLIDTMQMCLIEWSGLAAKAPRYTALSYVWGKNSQKFVLKESNLRQMLIPHYLEDVPIPKTIDCAMVVARNTGIKYLWVDSYCIIQDSKDDKQEQIPQMQEIYRRAAFTIVAAFGDSAEAGLPGVSDRIGNRFALHLKDIRVQFRGSCKMYTAATLLDIGFTENYIRGCPYLCRAWTFQEGMLSPRLLIFTASQVYWECERCTWCEDAHWESETIDFVGLKAIKNSTPTDVWNDRFERKAYDMPSSDQDEEGWQPLNSYAALIKEYSSRSLSWDIDILDACSGVLATIQETEQCDFVFGLRTKHFGNDLLFNILKAVPRRFLEKTPVEAGFPTWSWTAWRGAMEIANEARNNSFDLVENLIPCDGVRCYMLQTGIDGALVLRLLNEAGGWNFQKGYIRVGEGIYDPTDFVHDEKDRSRDQDGSGSDSGEEIPKYDQDVTLAQLQLHPGYACIQPNFHIVFNTFSTLVVVRLEYDELNMMMANVSIGGTRMTRTNGVWGNRDPVQRKVYACRKVQTPGKIKQHLQNDEESNCPCCDKDTTPDALPEGYELGPYLGRLPALSACWNSREYMESVPDGLYKMLWMNNNQLPMFGHLLCKPLSPTASKNGAWNGEILQRVAGVLGPTNIITKECQEHYCAEWGTQILA